jgi:hypothetical protein
MSTTVHEQDLHVGTMTRELLETYVEMNIARYSQSCDTYIMSLPNGIEVYYDFKEKDISIVA